jgi:type I restriction enzyme R subunit
MKQQFASSPDLRHEFVNAIISAMDAHQAMSTQALNSEVVQAGLLEILLGPGRLWERLREKAAG